VGDSPQSTTQRYRLRLFGGLELQGPDGPLPRHATQPRQLALLAILGMAGEAGCSRDKLVGCLWPESPEAPARHSLADAVYRVRAALGRQALAGQGVLRLNPDLVRCDVRDFEAALDARDGEKAVELFRGVFLDGFHLHQSNEFEQWVDVQRRRLGNRYAESVALLGRAAAASGDHQRAASWWRRLSAHDPFDTSVALRLMESMTLAGDPGNALLHGQEHCEVLRDALGIDPPADLVEAMDRIRAGESDGAAPQDTHAGLVRIPRPVVDELAAPVFVARESEIHRLSMALEETLRGRGRLALITGEAGTGKSALADEFRRRSVASEPGILAVTCRCNAHTGPGDPYHPFRELAASLMGEAPPHGHGPISTGRRASAFTDSVSALIEEAPDLIDTIVPEATLAVRGGDAAPGGARWVDDLEALRRKRNEGPPGAPLEQAAVYDQYVRWLFALARVRPLVICIDDLHWGDSGSIGLFFELGRRLEGARILLIGIYRSEAVALGRGGDRHPMEPVVNQLRRLYGDCEIRLGEEADPEFVEALVDAEPNRLDRAFRAMLFEFTRGHALFTVELLRGMRERGMLVRDEDDFLVEGPTLTWSRLPARVDAVIAERIGRVSASGRRVLGLAAVQGEDFTVELVAATDGREVDDLVDLLSGELEKRHQLVTATGVRSVEGRRRLGYRFRHIMIQQYVYASLDAVERVRLHERVGTALEELCREEIGEDAPRLARHFGEANRWDKAIRYHRIAAERARDTGAFAEAIAHFNHALALVGNLPESAERDRLELDLLAVRGTIYFGSTGLGLEEARRALQRAEELARRLGDRPQWLLALTGLFQLNHLTAHHREGGDLLSEVRQHAREEADTGSLVLVEWSMGLNSFNRGQFGHAARCVKEALALHETAGDDPLVLHFGYDVGIVTRGLHALILTQLGFPDQARRLSREAVSLAEEGGRPLARLLMPSYRLFVDGWLRDVRGVSEGCQTVREVAEGMGLGEMAIIANIYDGWCEVERGEPAAGAERIRAGVTDYVAQGWGAWRWHFESFIAEALGRCGRTDEGLPLLDEGLRSFDTTDERFYEAELHRLRGELLMGTDRFDEAETAFRRALEVAVAQEARWWELRAAAGLAALLLRQDRAREAHDRLAPTLAWFVEGCDTPDLTEATALLVQLEGR